MLKATVDEAMEFLQSIHGIHPTQARHVEGLQWLQTGWSGVIYSSDNPSTH
jgi:hypothetical protein